MPSLSRTVRYRPVKETPAWGHCRGSHRERSGRTLQEGRSLLYRFQGNLLRDQKTAGTHEWKSWGTCWRLPPGPMGGQGLGRAAVG